MSDSESFLNVALGGLEPKPADTASRVEKKRYSEKLSEAVAHAFAAELRRRGLREARPAPPGVVGVSGAERRISGGIGAKKVDVTWATEESGLLLAISVKSINFKDRRTKNFQKNLTNRRGDMLFEAVTLHRRFPYAVLIGILFLDKEAASDGSDRRKSTFENAHDRFKMFTNRDDPAGRDEQYEKLFIVLVDADPFNPSAQVFEAGVPETEVSLTDAFERVLTVIVERNPDFYEVREGKLLKR